MLGVDAQGSRGSHRPAHPLALGKVVFLPPCVVEHTQLDRFDVAGHTRPYDAVGSCNRDHVSPGPQQGVECIDHLTVGGQQLGSQHCTIGGPAVELGRTAHCQLVQLHPRGQAIVQQYGQRPLIFGPGLEAGAEREAQVRKAGGQHAVRKSTLSCAALDQLQKGTPAVAQPGRNGRPVARQEVFGRKGARLGHGPGRCVRRPASTGPAAGRADRARAVCHWWWYWLHRPSQPNRRS
jgi:hypothetical protein